MDANHGYNKATGRYITGFFFSGRINSHNMVIKTLDRGANLNIWCQFHIVEEGCEESIMLRYHLISMGIKVYKPTPVFVDNMSVVLNVTNPGSTLNNKTVALGYHFIREHVANNFWRGRRYTPPTILQIHSQNPW